MLKSKKENGKLCGLCNHRPAKSFCVEHNKFFCDECFECVHKEGPYKSHKKNPITEDISIKTECSEHKKPLDMFCVDEIKLCCSECVLKHLHDGHKTVFISDIEKDDSIFSSEEVKTGFESAKERAGELEKKIKGVMNKVENDKEKAQKLIEATFEAKHKALKDEEKRLMKKLEKQIKKCQEELSAKGGDLNGILEYSETLGKAYIERAGGKGDKLTELNIVCGMEKQRKKAEKIIKTQMWDVKFKWNEETGELSFARHLFNEAPRVRIIAIEVVSTKELIVSWETSKIKKVNNNNNDDDDIVDDNNDDIDDDDDDIGDDCDDDIDDDNNDNDDDDDDDVDDDDDGDNVDIVDDDNNNDNDDGIRYSVEMKKEGEDTWKEVKKDLMDKKCAIEGLEEDNMYDFRVRCVGFDGELFGEWSDVVKGRTFKMSEYNERVWGEFPNSVDDKRKYIVDEINPRIATKFRDDDWSTILRKAPLQLNKVTSWSIKVLKSKKNNGENIYIGVAPSDINQNIDNRNKCGWYFKCHNSSLSSGPPHERRGKEYGPRKGYGECVHTGDTIGVVMDTTKGDLSFILNGVNLGIAYTGIPLDKPLIPCVLLKEQGDSIELIFDK